MDFDSPANTPRAAAQDDAKPSKTRRKKAMHELQALGAALVELSASRLASVPLPDDLREAVEEARRIGSHEAKRRQLQYIGRLMREVDAEPIRARLAEWSGQSREAARAHHEIEQWRSRMLADDGALTEFAREYPGVELQPLRAMLREARRETAREGERNGRHFRDLFRLIRTAVEHANGRGEAPIDE